MNKTTDLEPLKWIKEFGGKVRERVDILWLFLRPEFLSDKQLRLLAVKWARRALSRTEKPDPRSVNACDVAERFANGEASVEDLKKASDSTNAAAYSAYSAAASASRTAAWAYSAAWAASAAASAAWGAAWAAEVEQQIKELIELLKEDL
jgi:hypothetical protein